MTRSIWYTELSTQTGVAIDEAPIEMRPSLVACAAAAVVGDRRRGGASSSSARRSPHRSSSVSVCARTRSSRRWPCSDAGACAPLAAIISICCWRWPSSARRKRHDARHTLCRHVADADRRVSGRARRRMLLTTRRARSIVLQQTAKTIQAKPPRNTRLQPRPP